MKKFLDLKANLIESKNQPSLVQVYLDSIRSSCYKISAPDYFNQCSQNIAKTPPIDLSSKKSPKFNMNTTKIKNSEVNEFNTETEVNKKKTERKVDLKFEEIFEEVQRKTINEGQMLENNEKIILSTIIDKLNLLQENKSLIPSIQIIKKIIYGMPVFQHMETLNTLHSHRTTPNQNCKNMHQSIFDEPELSCMQKSQIQNSQNYEQVQDEDFEAITENQSEKKQCQDESSPIIKYKRYNLDEIQEGSEEENNEDLHKLSDTMKSEDLNQWDDLQKITERYEEQSESSSIREQSIEFKKILYILQSTDKKMKEQKWQKGQKGQKGQRKFKTLSFEQSSSGKKENIVLSSRAMKTKKTKEKFQEKQDKAKTIKDIVKLLNNKYHRKVNFIR